MTAPPLPVEVTVEAVGICSVVTVVLVHTRLHTCFVFGTATLLQTWMHNKHTRTAHTVRYVVHTLVKTW
jgi:hypothetical protein